jgi:hypothetical protein
MPSRSDCSNQASAADSRTDRASYRLLANRTNANKQPSGAIPNDKFISLALTNQLVLELVQQRQRDVNQRRIETINDTDLRHIAGITCDPVDEILRLLQRQIVELLLHFELEKGVTFAAVVCVCVCVYSENLVELAMELDEIGRVFKRALLVRDFRVVANRTAQCQRRKQVEFTVARSKQRDPRKCR